MAAELLVDAPEQPASDRDGEIAGDAAILVDPKDPSAIAEAVGRVLSDEPLARKLSEAGRSRAATYTWAATGAGLKQIYREARGETT